MLGTMVSYQFRTLHLPCKEKKFRMGNEMNPGPWL